MDTLEQGQDSSDFDENDWAWGREEIGREIGRSASQVSYLLALGVLDGAVRRVGHRTIIGSKKKLRVLAAQLTNQP